MLPSCCLLGLKSHFVSSCHFLLSSATNSVIDLSVSFAGSCWVVVLQISSRIVVKGNQKDEWLARFLFNGFRETPQHSDGFVVLVKFCTS